MTLNVKTCGSGQTVSIASAVNSYALGPLTVGGEK